MDALKLHNKVHRIESGPLSLVNSAHLKNVQKTEFSWYKKGSVILFALRCYKWAILKMLFKTYLPTLLSFKKQTNMQEKFLTKI